MGPMLDSRCERAVAEAIRTLAGDHPPIVRILVAIGRTGGSCPPNARCIAAPTSQAHVTIWMRDYSELLPGPREVAVAIDVAFDPHGEIVAVKESPSRYGRAITLTSANDWRAVQCCGTAWQRSNLGEP